MALSGLVTLRLAKWYDNTKWKSLQDDGAHPLRCPLPPTPCWCWCWCCSFLLTMPPALFCAAKWTSARWTATRNPSDGRALSPPAIEPTPLLGRGSGGPDCCLTGQPAVRGERALLVAQRKGCDTETLCARCVPPKMDLATLTQSRLVQPG